MNLGFHTESWPDSVYRSVILHEFGHALGLIHEHQSPESGIPWDSTIVYTYYNINYGWDSSQVEEFIFKKFSSVETNYSSFDPNSIMIYAIPDTLTKGSFSIEEIYYLSEKDKEFIAELYPRVSIH